MISKISLFIDQVVSKSSCKSLQSKILLLISYWLLIFNENSLLNYFNNCKPIIFHANLTDFNILTSGGKPGYGSSNKPKCEEEDDCSDDNDYDYDSKYGSGSTGSGAGSTGGSGSYIMKHPGTGGLPVNTASGPTYGPGSSGKPGFGSKPGFSGTGLGSHAGPSYGSGPGSSGPTFGGGSSLSGPGSDLHSSPSYGSHPGSSGPASSPHGSGTHYTGGFGGSPGVLGNQPQQGSGVGLGTYSLQDYKRNINSFKYDFISVGAGAYSGSGSGVGGAGVGGVGVGGVGSPYSPGGIYF